MQTVDELFQAIRALPPRERLQLVELVIHELATGQAAASREDAIWTDVPEEEFERFLAVTRLARDQDHARTDDAQGTP